MQYVPEKGIYVYFRYNNQKTVMVIVNSNEQEETLATERFDERIKGFTKAMDVITGTAYNSIQTIQLPSKKVLVFELKK
jgi:galactokinase